MSTVAVIVVAVFFLAMGLYALVAPAALIRPFRLVADSPESRSEIRAVYGGFGVAVAGALAVAEFHGGDLRRGVTLTVALALTGMAVGRVVSRLVDRPTAFHPVWFYCCVEVVAGGTLFLVT
ncbi:DUF4345 domain-containing protein [Actinosynnema sp. NPDC047251]|uniref:Putative secreted protein n=1 Tax=Saccharothrix espanaensis (strain ATCC 51144 / DSM 44229 / JCM 9112 / NBRC 15066 / NRRL 15764) TaxID=1179773 RepID=K0JW47_SACES|nr:DUF4345 domain-containing protein [Saccharothrix espanaensis]CCH30251.1 putative secreted protein [Saccharothrix espanaensis DSM 44229]